MLMGVFCMGFAQDLCGFCHLVSYIWVNIGLGNGSLPDDTQPIPDSMLNYCQLGP